MIEVYSFSKNSIKKVELAKAATNSWIRIVNPDPQIIKQLAAHTNIPETELLESLEEEERPRVSKERYLEIIYRAPLVIDAELETLPIYFYIIGSKIITIEKKPLKILQQISDNMNMNKSKFLFKEGPSYFVFHVMDKINDDFLYQVDKIASKIDIYENFSKREMNVKDIEKVYDQSVTLSFFNQALIANVEVLNTLKKGYFNQISTKHKQHFEELYFDVLQILDTEKIQREALTNLINVHSIITSAKLNDFMKRLTGIALIVAIPTMLSGVYGMNFRTIPFAAHPYGFYIVSAIMILITFAFYYIFRKIDWL